MLDGFDDILWEDMSAVQSRTNNALEALELLRRAIQDGLLHQPTRQDSNRLNRLVVLTDLLNAEITRWIDELGINGANA